MSSGIKSRELAGRLAARRGLGLVIDAAAVELVDGSVVAKQLVLGVKYTVTSAASCGAPVICLRPETTFVPDAVGQCLLTRLTIDSTAEAGR